MKITLEALQVIDMIARCGTYGLAAEELHKAPSSLSYVVQKLEGDLGITVFDRSGHRVRLTRTGEVLIEEGRRLLRAASRMEERLRRVETGWETELRITTDAVLPFDVLVPFISAFHAENTHTRLTFAQEMLHDTWNALLSNRADLLIAAVGDPPDVQGLSVVPIVSVRPMFVVAPTHPLARAKEPVFCHTLNEHRFVEIASYPHPLTGMDDGVIDAGQRVEVPTLEAKESMLLAGAACGFLPNCAADPHIAAGRLIVKRLAEDRPARTLHIAWRCDEPGQALQWWLDRKDDLIAAVRGGIQPASSRLLARKA
jgi:DNA-binding transcriptional LysR family regulator